MFTLKIDTDNAAYEDPSELPRILRDIARKIEEGQMQGNALDVNGNICGKWHF